MRKRWLPIALLLFLSIAANAAAAPCQQEAETTASAAGLWCLAGKAMVDEPDSLRWSIETAGLWSLSIEGLPGQGGELKLSSDGQHTDLWKGALAAPGQLVSPPLFLTAGDYTVQVSAAGGPLVYRLRLQPGPALPAALPAGTVLAGAASALLESTGSPLVVDWDIADAVAGSLWTFSAQAVPGASPLLTLLDEASNSILATNRSDAAGVLRLPDLALAPGRYSLSLGGLQAGQAAIVAAEQDARPAGFAAEPDDGASTAHELAFGVTATGRLTTAGAWDESDVFVLTIPAGAARRVDAKLASTAPVSLTLALIDEAGTALYQRQGKGTVRLTGLTLAPGRHWLRVTGTIDPAETYRLVVEDGGVPFEGEEIEPNDVPAAASLMPPRGILAGSFAGDDLDYADLGVSGALQLWTVAATGSGITRLTLFDGQNNVVASTTPAAGEPVLRLSRLLLPPGRSRLRLDGTEGRWLLQAEALGPPVAGEEYEPNDDEARALDLVLGQRQRGWLDRSDDRDLYAFHLAAEHHVVIELAGPADFPIQASLAWGGRANLYLRSTTAGAEGVPQRLRWDSLLPPGDYLIDLSPYQGLSLEPYSLSVTALSYFDRPLDLEPNDEAWQARSLPPAGLLSGQIQDDSPDWFRLSPAAQPMDLQITALQLPGRGLDVRLARAGEGTWPETLESLSFDAVGDTARLTVPEGDDLLLQIEGGSGDYALTFGPAGAPVPAVAALPVEAALAFESASAAAYEILAQRLTATLTLHNRGDESLRLETASWTGDERARLLDLPPSIDLPPAATIDIPVVLEIAPDTRDGAIAVEVALRRGSSKPVVARTAVELSIGAAPAAAHYVPPLPSQLLGGLNAAWSALGGATEPAFAGLIDGIVDAEGVALVIGVPAVFELAGDGPLKLAGVILQPPLGSAPTDRLARFAVEVSDGQGDFTRVLEAELSSLATEQPFVFAQPVPGRLVRLIALSRHGGPRDDRAWLAEFKAVAAPGFAPLADIASPALGGHVVRAVGLGEQGITGEGSSWPGAWPVIFPSDRSAAPEWVLAFLNDRAAQVAGIVWHERTDTPAEQRARVLEVAASVAGPLGPWLPLGRWELETQDGSPPALPLAAPVWARALSFRIVEPSSGPIALPESIEVVEAAGPSVLGEWGDLSTAGPYEASLPPQAVTLPPATVGHERTAATALALAVPALGQVQRGSSEDWYALDLPTGTQWLRASFSDGRTPRVLLTLVDGAGRETTMVPIPGNPGELAAPAGPGPWHLRVTQPPQSVVASWDTSSSVADFLGSITRAIQHLAWSLDPAREAINLMPFRGDGSVLLLDRWSGDPAVVYGALHAYDWADNSSDAESALLAAVVGLQERVGARAVILITDAAYANVYKNEALWQALDQAGAQVFALHVPVEPNPVRARAQGNLMMDWANATGGFTMRLASPGDGEVAFRRVAAWLARPAVYQFALTAETTPLPPGQLSVVMDATEDGAAATPSTDLALEIVLDASGSMLAQLDGRARIEVAQQVLGELGGLLAEGLPVGLRVFGHRQAASCRSELLVPVGPLDRASFIAAVMAIRVKEKAKTALAEAIRLAGDDLLALGGEPVLLLITDGEETCGGDPLAEIERLRARGLEVRLQIVGFAVDDPALRKTFQQWAKAGNGAYFEAGDAAALQAAIGQAVLPPFLVLDQYGNEVARGQVNAAAVPLPPGRYRVLIRGSEYEVEIKSGEESRLAVPAS